VKFRVSQVGTDGLELCFDEDQGSLQALLGLEERDPTAVRAAGPLKVRGVVLASGQDLLVQGSVQCRVEVACRRCLATIPLELDLPLRATLLPRKGNDALPAEQELQSEDLEVSTYEGEEVVLDELVREQILLGAPQYPLCREDCAGLCPLCGKDLNDGACGCAEPVDPRFAKLRQIKIDPGE